MSYFRIFISLPLPYLLLPLANFAPLKLMNKISGNILARDSSTQKGITLPSIKHNTNNSTCSSCPPKAAQLYHAPPPPMPSTHNILILNHLRQSYNFPLFSPLQHSKTLALIVFNLIPPPQLQSVLAPAT